MNNYKLVVYEGNSGYTKLAIFKDGEMEDLFYLEKDNTQFGYRDSWIRTTKTGFYFSITEEDLKNQLDYESPSNYATLDEWQE